MDETTRTQAPSPLLGADWNDPLEDGVRGRVSTKSIDLAA